MKKLVVTMVAVACIGLSACGSTVDKVKLARHPAVVEQTVGTSVQKLTKFRDMTQKMKPIPVVYRGRCKILPTR